MLLPPRLLYNQLTFPSNIPIPRLAISFRPPGQPGPIAVVAIYRPPGATLSPDDWRSFLANDLSPFLSSLATPFILLGDMNARHSDWHDATTTQWGTDLASWCSVQQHHCLNATYQPGVSTHPSSQSIIDLGFTNSPNIINNFRVSSDFLLHSDHSPITVYLKTHPNAIPMAPSVPKHLVWRVEKANWVVFQQALEPALTRLQTQIPAHNVAYDGEAQPLMDALASQLTDALRQAGEAAMGRKRIHAKSQHWYGLPGVSAALREYHRARRQHQRHRQDAQLRTAYQAARTNWRKVQSEAERAAWNDLCAGISLPNNDNPDKPTMWAVFKRTCPQANKLSSIVINGQVPATHQQSLESLADFFQNTMAPNPPADARAQQFADQIEQSVLEYDSEALRNGPFTQDNIPFTIRDIEALVAKSYHTAAGPDDIPQDFLSGGGPVLIQTLFQLFCFSWTHSVVPKCWKIGKGVPLLKPGGNANEPGSYRLIMITSVIMRLFERLVAPSITEHTHPSTSYTQAGFMPHRSTHEAIMSVLTDIYAAMSKHTPYPVVFLDIVKAFDKVWHSGLLYKIRRQGVNGAAWNWIRGFLTGRSFYLVNDGLESAHRNIAGGVPQGCVLSPTLFLSYINDLVAMLPDTVLISLFADDIALRMRTARTNFYQHSLQTALSGVTEWASRWRMSFSPSKSAYVVFSRFDAKEMPNLNLTLQGYRLSELQSYKYLGLILESDMSWDLHSESVLRRLQVTAGRIERIIANNRSPDPRDIRTLVYGQLLPEVYAFELWRPRAPMIAKMERQVLRPLRRVLGLPPKVNSAAVLYEFGIMPLALMRRFALLRFAQRCLQLTPGQNRVSSAYVRYSEACEVKQHYRQSNYCRSIPAEVDLPESRELWNPTGNPNISLMRADLDEAQERCRMSWAHKKCPKLLALKPKPSPPEYFSRDPRLIGILRARLRLNRAALNGPLALMGVVDEPYCLLCRPQQAQVYEDTNHLLLHCQAYAAARAVLFQTLSTLGVSAANRLNVILGDVSDCIGQKRKNAVISATGVFLAKVNEIRRLV